MSVEIRADHFWVTIQDKTTESLENICSDHAASEAARLKRDKPFIVSFSGNNYQLTDPNWDAHHRLFTGTIWRVRGKQLPSKLKGSTVTQLDVGNDEDLGEATSFAYMPSKGRMLVLFPARCCNFFQN